MIRRTQASLRTIQQKSSIFGVLYCDDVVNSWKLFLKEATVGLLHSKTERFIGYL